MFKTVGMPYLVFLLASEVLNDHLIIHIFTFCIIGSAKSVQDLVSKFEWSGDSDTNVRKCSISSSSSKCKIPRVEEGEETNKEDYLSLPAVFVEASPSATSPDEKTNSDESIRRNRIEKYKEERRMELRQKYKVHDKCNDEKDEELIRRFKQKISKNELQSDGHHSPIDTSPTNEEQSKKQLSECKESPTKSFPAVTTINILYTSRKKKEEVDNEEKRQSQSNSNLEKLNEPCENNNIGGLIATSISKSSSNVNDRLKETTNAIMADKRPFTASLERKMCKLRSFVREESLVAKRVNQLSEASSDLSSSYRKSIEPGLV